LPPFDGTDAAVAAKGEMEIELQPAGRLRDEWREPDRAGVTLGFPLSFLESHAAHRDTSPGLPR